MMRIVALAIFLAVVAAEVAPLLHADNANVIEGSYIVVLKEHITVMERDAHIMELKDNITLANAEDSEVSLSYDIGTFIGFAARLNKALLAEQLNHPNVKYIEADQVMSINYQQERRSPAAVVTQTGAPWGLNRISERALSKGTTYAYNSAAGSGIDVYVIDTGIYTSNVDFENRASAVFNAIKGESDQDLNGHGTHCAGTIGGAKYGVAKKASLKGVKVLSASGSGSNTGVIDGVQYVTKNAKANSVASMSLGGGVSTALDSAVQSSIAQGIFYAIAAGNDNANACNYSPAKVPTACTVGATTNTDARASYSNYGTCLNVFAPGSAILSDWIGSPTATNTISGTSMATPHVAGVAALFLSQKSYSPADLRTFIVNSATANVVSNPGTGSTNFLLYNNPQ